MWGDIIFIRSRSAIFLRFCRVLADFSTLKSDPLSRTLQFFSIQTLHILIDLKQFNFSEQDIGILKIFWGQVGLQPFLVIFSPWSIHNFWKRALYEAIDPIFSMKCLVCDAFGQTGGVLLLHCFNCEVLLSLL